MILMGFNPDQQHEEEPTVPSNSHPGPLIERRVKTDNQRGKTSGSPETHGVLFQTEAESGIRMH